MNTKDIISGMAGYHFRANEQFISWLSDKSDEQLNQHVASSFPSILKTLNHMWATENFWYTVLTGSEDTENRYGLDVLDRDEVLNGLLNRSKALAEAVNAMTEEQLLEKVKIRMPWLEAESPRSTYIRQIMNHGSYHRGQIVTIAHQAGITNAPNTDYIFYAVAQEEASAV